MNPPDDAQESSSAAHELRSASPNSNGAVILVPPTGPMKPLRAVMHAPGALERFLADRDMD